jgi:hypothetical protein
VDPDQVRFITYTTRYNRDYWVVVDGLQRQFLPAPAWTPNAMRPGRTSVIRTSNMSRLLLSETAAAQKIDIDGDALHGGDPAASVLLVRERRALAVRGAPAATAGLRKRHDLQGPINDAFFDCVPVRGADRPAEQRRWPTRQGRQELDRFAQMFARDFCGEARTKDDTAVTAEDIAN